MSTAWTTAQFDARRRGKEALHSCGDKNDRRVPWWGGGR